MFYCNFNLTSLWFLYFHFNFNSFYFYYFLISSILYQYFFSSIKYLYYFYFLLFFYLSPELFFFYFYITSVSLGTIRASLGCVRGLDLEETDRARAWGRWWGRTSSPQSEWVSWLLLVFCCSYYYNIGIIVINVSIFIVTVIIFFIIIFC